MQLTNEGLYTARISSMRLRLQQLWEIDFETQKLKQKEQKDYKKINRVLYYQDLLFLPNVIWIKLINRHHNNSLIGHFGIKKTCKLLAQKYYLPTLCYDIEAHVKGYDVCLALKLLRYKRYGNLQSLPVSIHQ